MYNKGVAIAAYGQQICGGDLQSAASVPRTHPIWHQPAVLECIPDV